MFTHSMNNSMRLPIVAIASDLPLRRSDWSGSWTSIANSIPCMPSCFSTALP
ncbi:MULTISPECIES: hypothetical protein [unclassified Streptomyces]|uniref:hypothetical protein n=1 Tax=unclassified Streptomyces TaxID=2593676 RepID=UPI002E1F23D4|nr:hypothetical protein OG217_07930 [Streptomyces sp. NBC_01023]